MKVLLLGSGGRDHAIAKKLHSEGAEIYAIGKTKNAGINAIAKEFLVSTDTDAERISLWCSMKGIDMAIINPSGAVFSGLTDELVRKKVKVIAPSKRASMIEWSKIYMRTLMKKYNIPGQIPFYVFDNVRELTTFVRTHDEEIVMKPVGMPSGKGIRIVGEELMTKEDVIKYGTDIIEKKLGGVPQVLIEEKVYGEEFTVMAFTDGKTVIPMPPVHEYKRALEDDLGQNTGGMGAITSETGYLPYLSEESYIKAAQIIQQMIGACAAEKHPYKGIIYGQFMETKEGPRVIEFNVRFGDPETMNVMAMLNSPLIPIFEAIHAGTLDRIDVVFEPSATCVKYITPPQYARQDLGIAPQEDMPITLDEKAINDIGVEIFYANVNGTPGNVFTTGDRCLALLAKGKTVEEAHQKVESAL
ncbi:MAG: phosphoribosylamine--glycine ligase, partial [Thermoplasmata archaeon]